MADKRRRRIALVVAVVFVGSIVATRLLLGSPMQARLAYSVAVSFMESLRLKDHRRIGDLVPSKEQPRWRTYASYWMTSGEFPEIGSYSVRSLRIRDSAPGRVVYTARFAISPPWRGRVDRMSLVLQQEGSGFVVSYFEPPGI